MEIQSLWKIGFCVLGWLHYDTYWFYCLIFATYNNNFYNKSSWTIRCHRARTDNNWFISNAINSRKIYFSLLGLWKQFDRIDGFCAKINELFNGAFLERQSCKPASKSGHHFVDQSTSSTIRLSTYALTHFLYLRKGTRRRWNNRVLKKRFDFIYEFLKGPSTIDHKTFTNPFSLHLSTETESWKFRFRCVRKHCAVEGCGNWLSA